MFNTLLLVDSLRGMHSTGAASVDRYGSHAMRLAKQVGGPTNLFSMKEYNDLMNTNMRVLIGHNRHATVGEHTIKNAHPFAFDKIVGAHNGTLWRGDQKKLYKHDEFGTDSEALYANLEMFGIKSTVEHLSDVDSAYALTWFDRETNTINFLRNSKRPLVYAYTKDRCSIIWGSEARFIKFASEGHNIELYTDDGCKDGIYAVTVDTHYSWKIPENINNKFDLPLMEEVKPPVKTGLYQQNNWSSRWEDGMYTSHGSYKDTPAKPFIFGKHKRIDPKKFKPPYRDERGHHINKAQFEKFTRSQGCCFCGVADQRWGEFIQPFKSGGVTEYDYMCEGCYSDDDIYNICMNLI